MLATLRKLAVDSGANADGSYARAESLYGALVVEGRNDTVSGGDLVILQHDEARCTSCVFQPSFEHVVARTKIASDHYDAQSSPPLTDRMKVERARPGFFDVLVCNYGLCVDPCRCHRFCCS